MIVMKFGGSSLESAQAIQRVASIVTSHLDRQPAVIVSAMGKTTDRLLSAAQLCAAGKREAALREVAQLRTFHLREAMECIRDREAARTLEREIVRHFEELAEVLEETATAGTLLSWLQDEVLSFGERMSSLIVTAAFDDRGMDAVHLDARSVIVTDARHGCAAPQFVETNALLRRRVSRERVTVMGGFIGSSEKGMTTTLGRGGSDYTASIVGAALGVDEIQIWTDVDGILTCDPRVMPGGHCIRSVSYAEAEQMATAGAKVLHPATVLPAIRQRIPIVIRNSRNESAAGTRIFDPAREGEGAVLSISCRPDVTLLDVHGNGNMGAAEFGHALWMAFQEAGVLPEVISSKMNRFSLIVEGSIDAELLNRLKKIADITVGQEKALITLVGRNAASNSDNVVRGAQRISAMEGGAMLACCADSRFAFVVSSKVLRSAVSALHDEFFADPDPAIFVVNRGNAASVTEEQSQRRCSVLVPVLS